MKKIIFPVLLLLSISANLFGQIQIWEILSTSNQPYKNVVLDKISNDTLFVNAFGNTYPLDVDSIKYLKRERDTKSYPRIGVLLGMIGGGIIGNHVSRNSANDKGLFSEKRNNLDIFFGTGLGMILGGIFIGAAGSGIDADEYYNFERMNHNQKIKVLEKIVNRSKKYLKKIRLNLS